MFVAFLSKQTAELIILPDFQMYPRANKDMQTNGEEFRA